MRERKPSLRAEPPRTAHQLLRRFLPRQWRDDVLGDLREAFQDRAAREGRARAGRWYWRQSLAYLTRAPQALGLKRPRSTQGDTPSKPERKAMSNLMGDVRFAARTIRRNPGFALVVFLTLSLGIGAHTAAFSLMDAVLLRSLPVHEPERLVSVRGVRLDGRFSISFPIFEELQENQEVLSGLFADAGASLARVEMGGTRLNGARVSSVSGDYFSVLGVRPLRGRFFTLLDDKRGGNRTLRFSTTIFGSVWEAGRRRSARRSKSKDALSRSSE